MTLKRPSLFQISDWLNLLGAHAGVFFGSVNAAFAFGDDLDGAFWNYYGLIFGCMTVLATVGIPVYRHIQSRRISDETDDGADTEPFIANTNNTLTQYEKVLFTVAAVGTFVGPLNIARFHREFKPTVRDNDAAKIILMLTTLFLTTLALLLKPMKHFMPNAKLPEAMIKASARSGAWVGAIFAIFLTQFVVFKQEEIPPLEAMIASFAMLGLGAADIGVFYTQRTSVFLDTMRALVGCFGNVMAVPNILSLSAFVNTGVNQEAKRISYAAMAAMSGAAGLFHAARTIKASCADERDEAEEAPSIA